MSVTKRLEILDLIRELRQQLNENGHTVPSDIALKLIKEMLRKMGEPGKRLLDQYFPEAK
ncbi:transcriptional regulator [Nostoc sp. NMS4]|uniref:transcriptional regulator n=1 Tax=Nostoc sp. NMS4 TaxID=2815390 RepID=UPI0025E6BED7|nr:transcriptional regulator [Nostoc sp. NMS4]MBN3922119.1 transcriptional regulator [Nostoc sp. NMS4]